MADPRTAEEIMDEYRKSPRYAIHPHPTCECEWNRLCPPCDERVEAEWGKLLDDMEARMARGEVLHNECDEDEAVGEELVCDVDE